MPSITTDDGVRLHYTEHGNPHGRPVVLIAGFKAAATSWTYQQTALAESGYRVVSFDRRGHGLSERPDHGTTMRRHGADIAALLGGLDLTDTVLVGGSMGGNAIWAYVDTFGTDPIGAIVIVDQTPRMLGSAEWEHGFYGYDSSNRDTLFAESVPNPGLRRVLSKGPVRLTRLAWSLRDTKARTLTPSEKAILNDHAQADWRATIARADVPVLFVAGRQSEFWPAEHAAAAAGLAPQGSSVIIEKCGHAANIEQPTAFNTELLGFLRAV